MQAKKKNTRRSIFVLREAKKPTFIEKKYIFGAQKLTKCVSKNTGQKLTLRIALFYFANLTFVELTVYRKSNSRLVT
jgi:hypothetical protein